MDSGFITFLGIMSVTKRQACGLMALAAVTALFCAFRIAISNYGPSSVLPLPFGKQGSGTVAVSLYRDGSDRGVFFMPRRSLVSDLLRAAEVGSVPKAAEKIGRERLRAGDRIYVVAGAHPSVYRGRMSAPQLLALGLPLDLNGASLEEMILVPGIGEKTAAKIIALRQEKGGFRSLDELMEIRGIKEKRLAGLRKYLDVRPR